MKWKWKSLKLTNVIGIIGAMRPEVEILKSDMDIKRTVNIAHVEFYEGTLQNRNIVLVESGIGKVNASIITTLLINEFKVDSVINTGVAGSLTNELDILDMVISSHTAHHDVEATTFGYDIGQVPLMPLNYEAEDDLIKAAKDALEAYDEVKFTVGEVVSGDQFIDTDEKKHIILNTFKDAKAVDMESAAIAQTCYQFKTPYLILRSMSDKADGSADMNYDEFLRKACIHSSNTVKLVLKEL